MSSLSSSKTQQALISKTLPKTKQYKPRNGQLSLLKALAINPKIKTAKCIFPTGYGKTDAIELSYKLLKQQKRVDALFIIVPSKEQLSSYLASIEHDFLTKWGDEIVAYRFSADFLKIVTRDILQDKCEVVVATCQTLMTPGNLEVAKKLIAESGRRWMIALDELHRYSEYGLWGKAVGVLLQQNPEIVLGLTAAEERTDGQPVAMDKPEVEICVTYAEALEEGAIRPFFPSIHDYSVTIEFQGEIYDVKTSELSKLEGDYIEAKKANGVSASKALAQVREEIAYKDKYISPLVQNAVDCLYNKRQQVDQNGLLQSREHRMLVFARDQKHAEHLKNYFVKYGELSADWLGEKRPDEINEQILRDFIAGELDVMINVNKASEGFNCVQASVILFVNNVGPSVTILQQLGRGLRRNYAIPAEKDFCDLFLSEDHPAKEYFEGIAALQPKEFNPENIGTGGDRSTPIYDISDIQFVDAELHAVRVVNRTLEGGNREEMFDSVREVLSIQHGEDVANQLSMEMLMEALRQTHLPTAEKEVKLAMGSTDRIGQAKKSNAEAVRTLSTNIVRVFSLGNFNKSRISDVNRAVNTLLKKHFNAGTDSMNESELHIRHSFIQDINRKLKNLPREKFAEEFPTLCIS